MGRRLVVESANSSLKSGFVDTSEGFIRVFTTPKIAFLLAFTLAGYNVWAAKSFRTLTALMAGRERPLRRARRRKGTYADIAGAVVTHQHADKPPRSPPTG
jgi:hypothetical protein